MPRAEYLSYSPLLARPGALALFVTSIVAGIVLVGGLMGALGQAGVGAGPFVAIASLMMLPMLAGPLFGGTPMRVEVGADGIATSFLGWRRFVSFRDVEQVRIVDKSIELVVRGGKSAWLRPVRRVRRGLMPEPPAGSLLFRALTNAHRETLAALAKHASDASEARWARGDRPVASWVGEVLAAGASGTDYRAASLDRERLLTVAERPHADPSARAAAATVLRRAVLEPGERERLRVAAGGTANPRLRVALEAVLDEGCDERALAARLERVGR